MDGDFILQCGGLLSREWAFFQHQHVEYWRSRALLAETLNASTESPAGSPTQALDTPEIRKEGV